MTLQQLLSNQSAFDFNSIKSLSRSSRTMAVNVFKKKLLIWEQYLKINNWYDSDKGQQELQSHSFTYNTKGDFLKAANLPSKDNFNKLVKAASYTDEQRTAFIEFWKQCKANEKKCSLNAIDFIAFVNGTHKSLIDETETNDSETETNEDTKQTVLTLSCTQFDVNVSLRIEKDSNGDLKLITTNDSDQIENVLQFIKSNLF